MNGLALAVTFGVALLGFVVAAVFHLFAGFYRGVDTMAQARSLERRDTAARFGARVIFAGFVVNVVFWLARFM